MGCSSEVEGHPPGLEAHQEHPDIRVVCELLNHAVSVIHSHAALQPYTLYSSLHSSIVAVRLLVFKGRVHRGGGGVRGSAALQLYTLHFRLQKSILAERQLLIISGVQQGQGLGGTKIEAKGRGSEV